jgi:hypothetical protein
LRELIAAIDRRLPQLDRDGESQIARDATVLKRAALNRIAEIEGVSVYPSGVRSRRTPLQADE